MEEIRRRAQELNETRHSPQRYKQVGGKVSKNLKVQQRLSRSQNKLRKSVTGNNQFSTVDHADMSRSFVSNSEASGRKTVFNERSQQKLRKRDEEIGQKEDELEQLERELAEKRKSLSTMRVHLKDNIERSA